MEIVEAKLVKLDEGEGRGRGRVTDEWDFMKKRSLQQKNHGHLKTLVLNSLVAMSTPTINQPP